MQSRCASTRRMMSLLSSHSSGELGGQAQSLLQPSTRVGRKRCDKACDRCRLRKCKCDGSSPCSRCKKDDKICTSSYVSISRRSTVVPRVRFPLINFSLEKKSLSKIHPEGYVELLERQHERLARGLQDLYHRSVQMNCWDGPRLHKKNQRPLIHDLISALNLDGANENKGCDLDVHTVDDRPLKSTTPAVEVEEQVSSAWSILPTQSHHGDVQSSLDYDAPSQACIPDGGFQGLYWNSSCYASSAQSLSNLHTLPESFAALERADGIQAAANHDSLMFSAVELKTLTTQSQQTFSPMRLEEQADIDGLLIWNTYWQ